jgi:Ser/Thr protein kinase RdoA (MazF antagonist)
MHAPDFETLDHEQQLPILLELAQTALQHYDLPRALQTTLINLSENATYRIEAADGRRWSLRIHREGYHSKMAIASELAWAIELRQSGVAITPTPMPDRDGEIIRTVNHPRMKAPRHCVVFEWESGFEPGIGENLDAPFEALGEITACMHRHTRAWKRPDWFTRHTWDFETSLGDDNPHWGRWCKGIGVDAKKSVLFARTVALIGRRLAAYGKSSERFGLIHCDLRLANLLIDGPTVKVIDFDDCGFGWYMYDAATPVSFYEHDAKVPALIDAWKTGYRKVIALSKADEAEIPTFIMLRRLLLVAWIGTRHETDLAKSMGLPYTEGTVGLCENYLHQFA